MEVKYSTRQYTDQLDSSLLLNKTIVNISTSNKDIEEFSIGYSWNEGIVITLNDGTKLVFSYCDHEGGEFHVVQ